MAVLHVALALSLQEVGQRQVFQRTFDDYGDAVAFAPDAACFREDAVELAGILRAGEFSYWLGADYQFHEKLYSACFALFGGLLGFGIVGVEPVNLFLYLASLVLVFCLGREIFDRRAGLAAAAAVALWPSLLLHTTQLVRDPLFITLALALALLIVRWTKRNYSWAAGLLSGAAGALLATVIWLARSDMGGMLVATALLGAAAVVARQFLKRRACTPALAAAALLVASSLGVPLVMSRAIELVKPREFLVHKKSRRSDAGEAWDATLLLARATARIGKLRSGFVETYSYAGSNIDADVSIDETKDLLLYLPRAAEIGFFAPFPDMWLAHGKMVGSAGRLLAGIESLAMYLVEVLAVAGLWAGRRKLATWFLFSVAATGMTALGLVVVNVGALYRLRYLFLALLIILAAGGAAYILGRLRKREGGINSSSETVAATGPRDAAPAQQ